MQNTYKTKQILMEFLSQKAVKRILKRSCNLAADDVILSAVTFESGVDLSIKSEHIRGLGNAILGMLVLTN